MNRAETATTAWSVRGDDIISGQNGNDIIDGGPDRDRCRGGRGIDIEENCEL